MVLDGVIVDTDSYRIVRVPSQRCPLGRGICAKLPWRMCCEDTIHCEYFDIDESGPFIGTMRPVVKCLYEDNPS